MKHLSLLTALLVFSSVLFAQPGTVINNIKVDQFGYYPAAKKVAVVAKPLSGWNLAADGAYNPSTTANAFQVRRVSDNGLVYSGTLTAWNSGATHDQSGDKGWWFDFSAVATAGDYYVYDAGNNMRSYSFTIGAGVYDDVLKQALRVFFYQRINHAKQTPYADSRWADGACFEGAAQDKAARSLANTNPKDLSGGWMDAGDYNKYTTFSADAVLPLLEAYRRHPSVFGDNMGIPESGNGVSDLLDEVKWELEWLKRMQDATGTSKGLFLKVGVTGWNSATPPSTDANARYYLGECTSATISGAAIFSLASIVYRQLGGSYTSYADDLLQRAQDAWTRAYTLTSGFTTGFETACDDQTIKAGDADITVAAQKNLAFTAAVYLYEATGTSSYKTYIDASWSGTYPFTAGYWGPYYPAVQKALLRYAALPTSEPSAGAPFATASVANAIRNDKAAQNGALSINAYNSGTDLYRSFMPATDYSWGSNRTKCYASLNNYDAYFFNINTASAANYKETGAAYLHYLHGVNALGMTMLTNMYEHGGDNSANQMSHAWFRDGSNWDDAKTSLYGPPPGYLTGGCNQYYWVSSIAPPYGQLPLKAYKDWNTDWNNVTSTDEASYSITEPSISNQAAYVAALSDLIWTNNNILLPVDFLGFTAVAGTAGAQLAWQVDEIDGLTHFVVERSFDGRQFNETGRVAGRDGQLAYTFLDAGVRGTERTAWYRVRAVEATREKLSGVRKIGGTGASVWRLSPVPARNETLLEGRHQGGAQIAVDMYNAAGQLVRSWAWSGSPVAVRQRLVLRGLPPGLYWLSVRSGAGAETLALIKE